MEFIIPKSDLVRELQTGHLRHAQVGDQQIEAAFPAMLQRLDRRPAAHHVVPGDA